MAAVQSALTRLLNIVITFCLFAYFTLGFLLLFVWFYLACQIFCRDVEPPFQRLSHYFYRGFFRLVRIIMPRLEIRVDPAIPDIKSSVIVCNHLSYLDPILLISLFPRHRTIVKSKFFTYPFFSWVLKGSGYIPSSPAREQMDVMIRNMESLKGFFAAGGNLFVFPEGTRGTEGRLAPFEKGAFSIARNAQAPIELLRISNSDRLFPRGTPVFNACQRLTITLERVGTLSPDFVRNTDSLAGVIEAARACYREDGPDLPDHRENAA